MALCDTFNWPSHLRDKTHIIVMIIKREKVRVVTLKTTNMSNNTNDTLSFVISFIPDEIRSSMWYLNFKVLLLNVLVLMSVELYDI